MTRRTGLGSTVHYSTVQYSTVQYSTVQYSTVQYSTVQYSTVQYSTVQYNKVQYNERPDAEIDSRSIELYIVLEHVMTVSESELVRERQRQR